MESSCPLLMPLFFYDIMNCYFIFVLAKIIRFHMVPFPSQLFKRDGVFK